MSDTLPDRTYDARFVQAINSGTLQDRHLSSPALWRDICAARGRNLAAVNPEAWRSLCARRGRLGVQAVRHD